MDNKPILFNMTSAQLEQFVVGLGQPKFRAKQVAEWLRRGAPDFSVMKNLPESLRRQLDEVAVTLPCEIVKKLESDDGQTTKFLLRCSPPVEGWIASEAKQDGVVRLMPEDYKNHPGATRHPSTGGEHIETVLMRTSYGNSVCVSSQVGCAMGCKFCASTLLGLKRNLTANEMMAQILVAQWTLRGSSEIKPNGDFNNNDVSHIVIMGTGEPLQNTENAKGFLERANTDLNISWRRMTVSTCGIVPGIQELAEWGRPINLAISLHASDSPRRSELMPINKKYDVGEVLDAAFAFSDKTGRQLMIEYILLGGVNDSAQNAEDLSALLRDKNCMVNLIPWNAVAERDFVAPSGNAVHRFQDILIKNGVHTRIRRERGADIGSACGQLRVNS
ncbi:MAG: radical SAM protein [Alphaproteobacteria bacterium]|nr:radical SAM protein [Alphaproteobacteria bacterium]